MNATSTIPKVNLQLRMTADKKVAYAEDQDGVLHTIVFPKRLYAEAPPEVRAKYTESDYNVMVQDHYGAAIAFVQDRMKASLGLATRIVSHLAGY